MSLSDEEYAKEYEKAAAELEAAANPTTARDDKGQFAKGPTETAPEVSPEKPETTPAPVSPEPEKPTPDPLEEIRSKLEKTEKALKDTQAWGTKNAQRLAEIERESNERKRQAERPAILDANPELEAAIKFVVPAPEPQGPDHQAIRNQVIDRAHPGIFSNEVPEELVSGIMTRFEALGADIDDPIACIREINAEKLAFAERQVGKRFAAESAKLAQKSAMSVPGAGAGSGVRNAAPDPALAEVQRIQNMTDAEFQKEVRKVKGF